VLLEMKDSRGGHLSAASSSNWPSPRGGWNPSSKVCFFTVRRAAPPPPPPKGIKPSIIKDLARTMKRSHEAGCRSCCPSRS